MAGLIRSRRLSRPDRPACGAGFLKLIAATDYSAKNVIHIDAVPAHEIRSQMPAVDLGSINRANRSPPG